MTIEQFSKLVELAMVDAGGAEYTLTASEAERAEIARLLDVPALNHLNGVFRLAPTAGGVDIRLALDASAERRCIVSLEPMRETIREEFKIRLERNFDDNSAEDVINDDWTREPLETATIDLADMLVQHLSLSLDPHPRKPGAKSLLEDYRDAASPSPFAVLKGLVDRDM